ncbi:MAG: HNH endonuclease [Planctomycetes bacterium]|nr:HNH endonuclease [Planctomycetota bacterium]
MTSYVSAELRRLVVQRSLRLCEYCLIHESDTYLGCQVDHILSEKHGGLTELDNLAFACTFCNRSKGTDIASLTQASTLARFFNPRTDKWRDHFQLNGARIIPLTEIGEATARILGFNTVERLREREVLSVADRYPCPEAFELISRV